ncbi:hypothetical protein [Methylocapsa palsarum]|uniref:Broad specificity phosphatase PhoE n=1 Tax=Methylocapsa palsarum TaxID=1612308 RepID=A0A1I3YL29_9HYPH|nr:hypothetical protein [Methylocapsa palsarum]SFK32534.1 hypothetical protein SAMN05444581_10621 [Methylocapsa palsarum]
MPCEKIMLIRHAERPSPDKTIRGVGLSGEKDKESLTVRGWQRAGALVRYFAPLGDHFAHPALATPHVLYACKAGPQAPSLRPQHTLLPLADFLRGRNNAAFNRDFYEGEEKALVEAVLGAPGPAVIAWKHNTLPLIANLILGDTSAPQSWPFSRVDMVWVFDRLSGGWTMIQVPQLLLAGDSDELFA